MPDWIRQYVPETWSDSDLVIFGIVLTVTTMIVSLIMVGVVLVRIPANYFVGNEPPQAWVSHRRLIRWPLIAAKNVFGVFLVLLGLMLSVPGIPGQGILTILIGAMLIDFPGKRRVEKWLLRRRGVLKNINRLRARYGRQPLVVNETPPV